MKIKMLIKICGLTALLVPTLFFSAHATMNQPALITNTHAGSATHRIMLKRTMLKDVTEGQLLVEQVSDLFVENVVNYSGISKARGLEQNNQQQSNQIAVQADNKEAVLTATIY